jgi:hypothetical protein
MAQVVSFALAVSVGFVAHDVARALEHRRGRRLFTWSPRAWGIACAIAGLIPAFFAPAFVVAGLAGFVAYKEAVYYQLQCREDPLGVPPWLGALAAAICAFFGAALGPLVVWVLICAGLALAGAVICQREEMNRLREERELVAAENRRLIAAKNTRPQVAPESPSTSPPSSSPRSSPSRGFGGDILPHR